MLISNIQYGSSPGAHQLEASLLLKQYFLLKKVDWLLVVYRKKTFLFRGGCVVTIIGDFPGVHVMHALHVAQFFLGMNYLVDINSLYFKVLWLS